MLRDPPPSTRARKAKKTAPSDFLSAATGNLVMFGGAEEPPAPKPAPSQPAPKPAPPQPVPKPAPPLAATVLRWTPMPETIRLRGSLELNFARARELHYWNRDAVQSAEERAVSPARELICSAYDDNGAKRVLEWRRRWEKAGGTLYGKRMVARVDSPVWLALSRFGLPFAPFDFDAPESHHDTERVFDDEAEELGVVRERDIIGAIPRVIIAKPKPLRVIRADSLPDDYFRALVECVKARDVRAAAKVLVRHEQEYGRYNGYSRDDTGAQLVVMEYLAFPWETWFEPVPPSLPEIIAARLLCGNEPDGGDCAWHLYFWADEFTWRKERIPELRERANRALSEEDARNRSTNGGIVANDAEADNLIWRILHDEDTAGGAEADETAADVSDETDDKPTRITSDEQLLPTPAPKGNPVWDWVKKTHFRGTYYHSDAEWRAMAACGFFAFETDEEACFRMLRKADFAAIAAEHGIPPMKKSAKKAEMFAAIRAVPAALAAAIAKTPAKRRHSRHPAYAAQWAEIDDFYRRAAPHGWVFATL
jgi:hypothetical protein